MKRAFSDLPYLRSTARGLGAISIVVAGLFIGGAARSQTKPAAKPAAAPKAKASASAPLPAPVTGKPLYQYTVTNEKGPGLPIVVATQPWPATVLGAAPVAAAGPATPAPASNAPPILPGQEAALQQLQVEADAYKKSAGGYAKAVGQIMMQRYQQKRKGRLSQMQENIDRDTAELKKARLDTIERLKVFLAKYPDVEEHTPNAMFRLAALYEEQAVENDLDPGDPQYTNKLRSSYGPAESLYRDIISRFPKYSQRAAVQFFLGALLADTGRGPESQWVWRALVCSNHYEFPLPATSDPNELKLREKWKDGIPPMPQDHTNLPENQGFWDKWRETHYTVPDPKKKKATPKPTAKAGKAPVKPVETVATEDSYTDPYPDDCVAIPAPIPPGEDEPRFIAQTWWRMGEYHYSRGDESAEEEGYFGASPYRYNRAHSAYQHATKTNNETVKVFTMYKIAWTYFKQQRYNAARKAFLALLEYFDEKSKKGQSGDEQMRQDAYDYIASSLTYLDLEGPGPDEPYIERDDIFGQFSGKALEKKLEVAIDRVQDPKLVPQDRPWTPKVYKALAAEFESDETQLNAIKTYEIIIQKWPCDPEAPQYQQKIAQLYDMLALKAEPGTADKEEYAAKALEARTKLLDYVGKDSKWVECNKNNPDAIRAAEALMTEGVKNAAGRHTALGRQYVSKAQSFPDGSPQSIDNLNKAREEYRLALKGWQAYLAQDPDGADSYESRYWIADSLHKIVVITHAKGEDLDPKMVKDARDAAIDVRDSNLDDKYMRYAAFFAVDVYDRLAEEGFDKYKKSNCTPGYGNEVVEDPTWEPGDYCLPEATRDREEKRIWIRPIPDSVVSTLREREDFVAKVPKSIDVEGSAPKYRYYVADTLYRYGRWDEATPRYEQIWRENCGKNELGFEAWYRLVVMSNMKNDTSRSIYLVNETRGAKSCAINDEQKIKEKTFSEATSIEALFKEADDAYAAAEKETDPKKRAALYREAAAKYEAALKVAPSKPQAPRAAINAAYCYKQVNEYKKAAEVYRYFLDKYGKEDDLIAYRDGDPKKGIKKDPEQFKTRLDYTKKALGELGRTYLQAFDYQNAAKHYDEVANRTLLDQGERRDAAFNAVVLQANLGNRDKMLDAKKRFMTFSPTAAERAELDFIIAEFEYKQYKTNPKDPAQRGRAITALDSYYTQYKTQGPAAKYVVDVAYDMATIRKDAGDATFRDWYKKTMDAFASYSAGNANAKSSRESDFGAEAAYFFIDEKIQKEWDSVAGQPPRVKYEGDAKKVVTLLEADDKKRRGYLADLENVVKVYISPKWTPVVYAREGSVNDVMRSALARSKVEVLDPTDKKKIDDLEKKAQKILDNPNSTPEDQATAQGLLEKIDQIRGNTTKAWTDKRAQYYAVLEPEMMDRYARGYLRGKQFNAKDPWITRAVQRLAYYEDQMAAEKIGGYLGTVEKDFPGFKYHPYFFKSKRPGAVSAPLPNVDHPVGPAVGAGATAKAE